MADAVRLLPEVKPQAMFERDDREDRSRGRSLLAFGKDEQAAGANRPALSLLSVAEEIKPDVHEDAAARHRLARELREARSAPLAPQSHNERPVESVKEATAATRSAEAALPASGYDALPARGYEDNQRWKPLIDPMKVIDGVARSKKLIVATTLAGALLGVMVALSTPKKFEAVTELIADPRNLQITDHDLTQSSIASDTTLAIVENQVRVLTSSTVLDQVAVKLNLFDDPEFNGQGQGFPGVMTLIRSLLSRGDAPGGQGEDRLQAIVIRNLAESLTVERGGKTFVISIGAKTENGEKSALIANTMADVFLQTYGKMQSDTAGRATDELTARLDELRNAVETAERKLESFKAEHDLIDAQGRLISDDELVKLNDQLTVARARTLELNAKAASARTVSVDSVVAGTLPEEIGSDAMNDLRSQYSKLKQEADRAAVRLGPRHPERLALDAQLAGARERISAELRRIASSLQTDLKRAVQLEQQLSSRLAQLKVRSSDVNGDLVTARELERDVNAKRAVYEAFLLRAKQTSEQKDINTANISVISKAYPPLDPTGPSRAFTALVGLLLGFASGIGLGAMRGAFESLRESADERAQRLPYPASPVATGPKRVPRQTFADAEPSTATLTAVRQSPVETLRAAIAKALRRTKSRDEEGYPAEAYEQRYEEPHAGRGYAAAFASDDSAKQAKSPTHPDYADPNAPFAPRQPTEYPQPPYQQPPQFHPAMYAPQPYPPQAPHYPGIQPVPFQQAAYPVPPVMPQPFPFGQQPMGYAQPWQPQPLQPVYPYAPPMPQQAAPMPYAPAAQTQPQRPDTQGTAEDSTAIEEIRASMREFRDAVRDLTESRSRRRYF